jgi:predicted membrane-bound mannosyltransferase
MTIEKVLYPTRVHITGGWKKVLMLHPLLRIVFISLLAAQATPNRVWAQMKAAPPLSGVIGKVQSVTESSVEVQTPSGVVHVDVKQPLTTYKQIPSDLSHVTSTSYVGVASTEQADGKEVAKQIIIFPEELRGAAEGSVLTDPPGATTHSRMTNGSVSRPPVSHSRMTNGTVLKGSGTTLVVQYQDGSKTISVPANVAVTEVAPEKVTLDAGDTIYLTTDKLPNGTLTTNKILVIAPAVSPNTKQ